MNKEDVVLYIHSTMFSHEKDKDSDHATDPWKSSENMLKKINQSQMTNGVWFHWYEVFRIGRIIDI